MEGGELVFPAFGASGLEDLEVGDVCVGFEQGAPAVVGSEGEESVRANVAELGVAFEVAAAPRADVTRARR